MKLTHRVLVGLSLSGVAGLVASPALAQGYAAHESSTRIETGPQATMFLRIPFGGSATEQTPRFGLSLATGCAGAFGFTSQTGRDACDARPFRSLELSTGFGDAPWALSFGGAGQRREIAAWSPDTGKLSFAGEGGSGDWIWIGLGVAAGIGVAAALSEDDEPTLCTGNTIPNPLSGECEPLVIG